MHLRVCASPLTHTSFTGNGKLSYMTQGKKRELDPRALERGSAIIDARKRHQPALSQEDLAKELGVDRVAVSHWERGKVGEIERSHRLGLCKLLGFEEWELLLDQEGAEKEFEMPLSREAKSIAYEWDDLPESVRTYLKGRIAEAKRILKSDPEYAKHVFPELSHDPSPKLPPPKK